MTRNLLLGSVLLLCSAVAAAAFSNEGCVDSSARSGSDCVRCHNLSVEDANRLLSQVGTVKSVKLAAVKGFYEIVLESQGKQVIAYLVDTRPQLDKLAEFYGGTLARREGCAVDPDGLTIENFELPVNLMLGISCQIVQGGLEDAVLALAAG